ncbi:uncharacterized protein [Rutidosis leptorrhynchoides]|uniref:uncharacterized protein n=1 Tax=Rutidosis leptorrhynchoides TaxID=125765 RepID=UPI003A999AE1
MATQIKIHFNSTLFLLFLGLSSSMEEGRYITKSYFDHHGSLVSSEFQKFITQELGFASCDRLLNPVVKSSVTDRKLIGEGSHRRLSTSIRLSMDSQMPNCKIVIIEKLPSGVFADPFELENLQGRGVFKDVAVFGDTNLELPSFLSNRSVVEIHMNSSSNLSSRHHFQLEINVELPVHARYQPLDESGYTNVEFEEPDVIMHCINEALLDNHHQNCLLVSKLDGGKRNDVVVWRIPSGKKAHSEFVSVITFFSAVISTLSIVWASVFCSSTNLSKSLNSVFSTNSILPFTLIQAKMKIFISRCVTFQKVVLKVLLGGLDPKSLQDQLGL